MAYENNVTLVPLVAEEDMSTESDRYRPVKLGTAEGIKFCSATADRPLGILYLGSATNGVCSVATSGLTKIQLDATIADGAGASCGLNGTVIGEVATAYSLGTIQKGGASGEIGTIALNIGATVIA